MHLILKVNAQTQYHTAKKRTGNSLRLIVWFAYGSNSTTSHLMDYSTHPASRTPGDRYTRPRPLNGCADVALDKTVQDLRASAFQLYAALRHRDYCRTLIKPPHEDCTTKTSSIENFWWRSFTYIHCTPCWRSRRRLYMLLVVQCGDHR